VGSHCPGPPQGTRTADDYDGQSAGSCRSTKESHPFWTMEGAARAANLLFIFAVFALRACFDS
jgi:hypothetical protein